MSSDITLLALCKNRDTYGRFVEHAKKHVISSVAKDIMDAYGGYFSSFPSRDVVDKAEFTTFFFVLRGKAVKDASAYNNVLKDVFEAEVSEAMEDELLGRLIELDYATKAHALMINIHNGKASFEEVEPMLHDYRKERGSALKKEDIFVAPDLSYLSSIAYEGGLSWRLPELNVSLGPIRKGDFIIFAARPETGKTTMMASEATHFLSQIPADEHIIWINNEEASNKVMMRCIQSYHGITSSDMVKSPADYTDKWKKGGGERFLILDDDSSIKSVNKISALFKQFKPAVIIFDQLDKVHGFHTETREDLRIGKLYEWARDVAKEYCPVIAISQVDGTGEGEKWIHMNQLRGSKTDKVGEADAIVTIGKSNEAGMDLKRFIHVPKNKLFGGPSTHEAHRHGMFELEIDPIHARYKSFWR